MPATTLGAACFLACALTACGLGATLKAPRLRQLRNLPRLVTAEVAEVTRETEEACARAEDLAETVTETVIDTVTEDLGPAPND